MFKAKFNKKRIQKAIKSNSTLEDAATDLGVDRRTLYTMRVNNRMPIAQRG